MTEEQKNGCAIPDELNLLFFGAGGVTLAVDSAQVDFIIDGEETLPEGLTAFRLGELLGMAGPAPSAAGPVLCFKGDETCGLAVERLFEIASVRTDAVQAVPYLLECAAKPAFFWGLLLRNGSIVPLLDPCRLSYPKSHRAAATA